MEKPSIGLALASGGAGGAYQAGALLYFAERGVRFSAIAGTSIGALNGAYYAQGDGSPEHIQQLKRLWRTVPDAGILQVSKEAFVAACQLFFSGDLAVIKRLIAGEYTLFDPGPIAELLDTWLDYEKIKTSSISTIVTVFPQIAPLIDVITATWRRARYLRLQKLDTADIQRALLASSAIPMIFPSQSIEEKRFGHGGLVDPLPAQILYQEGARRIVSIFLSNRVVQNRVDFQDCTILQIHPPATMKSGLFSLADFSQEKIDQLIDLGYETAKKCFEAAEEIFADVINLRNQGAKNVQLAQQLPERKKLLFPED